MRLGGDPIWTRGWPGLIPLVAPWALIPLTFGCLFFLDTFNTFWCTTQCRWRWLWWHLCLSLHSDSVTIKVWLLASDPVCGFVQHNTFQANSLTKQNKCAIDTARRTNSMAWLVWIQSKNNQMTDINIPFSFEILSLNRARDASY